MTTNLEELAEKVKRLSPPDRLRLAADLLEGRELDLAEAIVSAVHDELVAVQLLTSARAGRR